MCSGAELCWARDPQQPMEGQGSNPWFLCISCSSMSVSWHDSSCSCDKCITWLRVPPFPFSHTLCLIFPQKNLSVKSFPWGTANRYWNTIYFLNKKKQTKQNQATTYKPFCRDVLGCGLISESCAPNHSLLWEWLLYSWREVVSMVTFSLKAGLALFPRSGFWCEYLLPNLIYIWIFPLLKIIFVSQWRKQVLSSSNFSSKYSQGQLFSQS